MPAPHPSRGMIAHRPSRWGAGRWRAGVGAAALLAAVPLAACTSTQATKSASGAAPSTTSNPTTPAPATGLTPTASAGPSGGGGSGTVGPPPTTPAFGAGGARTLVLGPGDSGKTVPMRVGDRLAIALTANRLIDRWTLVDYPRNVLRPDLKEGGLSRFVLLAIAPGSGQVTLAQSSCGYGARPCLDRPPPIDPTNPAPERPSRLFTVTVRVM